MAELFHLRVVRSWFCRSPPPPRITDSQFLRNATRYVATAPCSVSALGVVACQLALSPACKEKRNAKKYRKKGKNSHSVCRHTACARNLGGCPPPLFPPQQDHDAVWLSVTQANTTLHSSIYPLLLLTAS